jgi:hypothetical protein
MYYNPKQQGQCLNTRMGINIQQPVHPRMGEQNIHTHFGIPGTFPTAGLCATGYR